MSTALHKTRFAGYFLAIGGVAILLAGVWYVNEGWDFLNKTVRADGSIVALKRERSTKGIALDHAVVRFTPAAGSETVEFKSRAGLRPSPFAVGESVEVAFDAADPHRARINSFWTIWFIPCVIVVFGAACIAAGMHTLRTTKPRQ